MTSFARLGSVGIVLAIVALWGAVVAAGAVPRVFLPGPGATVAALCDGLVHGDLLALTLATIRRMIVGWILASVAGVALGTVVGLSRHGRAFLLPTLEFLRPLPASSLLPVGIALFGLTPGMLLVTVAFGAIWPTLLATVHGFSSMDQRLHEVARVLRLSRTAFVIKLGLPNALPDILSGMRLSLTASLIVTVVGEMLTAQTGLGTTILMAGRTFRSTDLYAGVILLGLVGFLNNTLLELAERRLLAWRRR
ncbi:ABC transporter permease [Bradyrhizobium sp. 2TAF24]|uniref:ABC transporter permease n=1 Tax=Bradyrhizobium sp. 2TAF24 TaxID=3233011 RepID=UPI003F927FBE